MRTERNIALWTFLVFSFFLSVYVSLGTGSGSKDETGVSRRLSIGKISWGRSHESLPEVTEQDEPHRPFFAKMAAWIAKTYDITDDAALDTVRIAHRIGAEVQVDPLLILAVICVESRFIPTASSGAGAVGLMQVVPKWHAERIRGMVKANLALTDPETNIRLGGAILKDYLRIARGRLPFALQMYNGSADDEERRYSERVLARFRQLGKISQSQGT